MLAAPDRSGNAPMAVSGTGSIATAWNRARAVGSGSVRAGFWQERAL